MRSAYGFLAILLVVGAGLELARHVGGTAPAPGPAVVAPARLAGLRCGHPELHFAPAENLETVDVAAIDTARRTIDMAAFVLTDQPVLEALIRAARRGVEIRILFDRGQLEFRPEAEPLIRLQDLPGVVVRVKRGRTLMHLKAYAVDGHLLRTGSANFTASGLKRQDNDLVLIESREATGRFLTDFEAQFQSGGEQ